MVRDKPELPVLFDARWCGAHGIGRFAREILARVSFSRIYDPPGSPSSPLDPWLLSCVLRYHKQKLYYTPGYNAPFSPSSPFVFTIHDLNHLFVEDNSSFLKRLYYQRVMRPATRYAQYVLTVSEFSRQAILEWSGVDEEKVINVGNGVSSEFSVSGPVHDPGYDYLLFVGNRKAHKNLPRIIEAYAASRVCGDVHLLLSGERDEVTDKLVRNFGLENVVHFSGHIAEADLPAYYRGAKGLLFVSLYEGFGLPIVEAMACGIPVLTSTVSAMPETAGDAAFLVDPYDVDEIASGMDAIMLDEALRHGLISRGLVRAGHFSWDATAEKVSNVLSSALEQI